MFRKIEDFREEWGYEREATGKVLSSVTDAALGQRVSPGGRTLGQIAWHIVGTLHEMPVEAGLVVEAAAPGPMPATAAEMAAAYRRAAEAMEAAVVRQWNDAALEEEITVYGERWPRGKVLSALIRHEAHHRGQMTVLLRQAGLVVPGVYGPAKEEWRALGMSAPE